MSTLRSCAKILLTAGTATIIGSMAMGYWSGFIMGAVGSIIGIIILRISDEGKKSKTDN